jgi:PAS domain S-box-containing protein
MTLRSPLVAAARLVRGWRLQHQLLVLMALTTAAAMAVLYAVSGARIDAAAHNASHGWALSLARAAASSSGPALMQDGAAMADPALRQLAGLSGVLRLELRNHRDDPVLRLQQLPDGRVGVVDGPGPDAAPARVPDGATGADSASAWAPVGPGGSLGRVGVTVALAQERAELAAVRYDSVLAIAFSGLALLLASYGFLRHALTPLSGLVQFAGALAVQAGARLPPRTQALELQELSTALNDASAMLRSQLDVLDAAQARTQAIVNAVPDVILGLDADCCITIANPSVASVFGLQPEELRGRALSDVLPGLTQPEAEKRTLEGLFMRATRTHVARYETTARRRDGTEFPVEVSLSRIETEDGARYAAVVRDVTELRMTFSMLNLYSRALECTSNGVTIIDMKMRGKPVFYANAAYARITGYAPCEVIGRSPSILHRDDQDQPGLRTVREAIAAGREAQVVLRNYRKDGTLFFNELAVAPVTAADGSVPHYVGVITDVTERERTRMAMAERSARLNAVFDLSPDGFVVFGTDGRLAHCNRAFLEMTGWGHDTDASGLTVQEFDQRFRVLCEAGQTYLPVQALLDISVSGTHGPDTLLLERPEHRVLARVVRSHVDDHDETILFFRDVTRETEVDRMKSEFLTTAAHELRTPMVSVFGFTELLLNRPVSEVHRRDMLQTMHRQASLLINMVNELLDLARIEARQGKDLKREACRLDSLVNQAVGPLRVAKGLHRFELDVPHGDQVLWVDPEKTHRALINVLGNAVKYTPQGGTIHVSTRSGTLRGEPAVGLSVADPGIGMSAEQASRVFERFYRADPSGNIPGTGLGMSLVKEIVELQGGRVDLVSAPGQGTRVTLWFALHAAPALSS